MSKLTFIIPVYKKAHILEKCLKSICEQSLTDWDLVAVLDGPDKECEAIINKVMKKKANHYKIVVIEHGGACKARNAGFAHAKGDNVVFWDSDCVIEPHTAKAWIDILDRQPEIGFVYSGYKFIDERGAINSEPFDPWLLRVRNYISSCFPVRRTLAATWNESLKSLQDWDFWLSVVEKGGVGKFLTGYGFSTEFPTRDSISGQGCTEEWLERVDAVKKLHNLPERSVCVTSFEYKQDAINLAKLIGADYQDYPQNKPHIYKTMIQVGFSMKPDVVMDCAQVFSDKTKNFIFWMPNNINEVWREISFEAITKYSILLNGVATQFVEDKTALDLMTKAGFKASVMPMPMKHDTDSPALPDKPTWAVDIDPNYGKLFALLDRSLPDISLEVLTGNKPIADYTGMVHFWPDKTLSNGIKRMLLTGRHVISNVKDPFCGHVNDSGTPEKFIDEFITEIRKKSKEKIDKDQVSYYKKALSSNALEEAIR